MIRRLVTLLVCGLVALGSYAALADEPPPDTGDAPLRLKKKAKPEDKKPENPETKKETPKPEEKKTEEKKAAPAEEPAPTEPQVDEKEVIERIARNMRSVDDRLAKGEVNDSTRQMQDDILKDIESLIRLSENPSQSGGGAGQQDKSQGEQNQQDQNSSDQKNEQGGQQGKQTKKPGSGQGSGQQTKGQASSGQDQSSGQRQSAGKKQQRQRGALARSKQRGGQRSGPGRGMPQQRDDQNPGETADGKTPNGGEGTDKTSAEVNRIADLNKQDVWGHLPESVRASMNAYAGRQEFMAKHEALIKKYYSTIATEGRRKGDQP
jgi:hypothetical protein